MIKYILAILIICSHANAAEQVKYGKKVFTAYTSQEIAHMKLDEKTLVCDLGTIVKFIPTGPKGPDGSTPCDMTNFNYYAIGKDCSYE